MAATVYNPERAARRHREVLAIACLVAVLAFALRVLPDQDRVAFRGLAGYPLPPLCSSRAWFGIKCPGCGLTRSIIHLARADWSASVASHRIGWVMAAVIVLQIPYRLLALRRVERPLIPPVVNHVVGSVLIALLIGNWVFDVLRS